jgi:hypothetical protein
MKKLFKEYGNRNEREVYLMPKTAIEKIVDDLDVAEIYKMAYEEGEGYTSSGTANVILNAGTGEIYSQWLQQNNFTINNFTEVVLLSLITPIDTFNAEDLIADEEQKEFEEFDGDAEDYLIVKYGEDELEERKMIYIEWWADRIGLERERIQEQIDKIYEGVIEDDEEF